MLLSKAWKHNLERRNVLPLAVEALFTVNATGVLLFGFVSWFIVPPCTLMHGAPSAQSAKFASLILITGGFSK